MMWKIRGPVLDSSKISDTFHNNPFFQRPFMNRILRSGLLISLVMSLVLGGVPLGAMTVCVHAGDVSGQKAIHLHYGQLPAQPCDDMPLGSAFGKHREGRRHFSLMVEKLSPSRTRLARLLDSPGPSLHQYAPKAAHAFGGNGTQCTFDDPAFVFLDTAFTHTTILII